METAEHREAQLDAELGLALYTYGARKRPLPEQIGRLGARLDSTYPTPLTANRIWKLKRTEHGLMV